jgi:hypothetical protein
MAWFSGLQKALQAGKTKACDVDRLVATVWYDHNRPEYAQMRR